MDLSKIKALTIKHDGIANILMCSVTGSFPLSLADTNQVIVSATHYAIWDTGASSSAVTELFAKKLGLKQTGVKIVSGLGGSIEKKTYLINLILPNGMELKDLPVSEIDNPKDKDGNPVDSFGILIGMDIISMGDFSISNCGGKTVMTFRTPSQVVVDYVQEWKRRKAVDDRHKGKR